MLEQKPLSPLLQAQRLGNAIAFRTFIKIGSESFDSIEDFNKYLLFLYDNNLAQLHTLIKDSESEIDVTFSTLMGDKVEPRREFIEANAKYVKNLDI